MTAPKRGRPRRGPDPERFHEIVDAAAQIIHRKGYSATSIQDIAEAVGVLKGSLYHYVKSKEDFLYAIIDGATQVALQEIQAVARMEAGPVDRLTAFVGTHVRFATSHLTAYSIRLREMRELGQERREKIQADGAAYNQVMRDVLVQGQQQGVFDAGMDVDLMTTIVLGQMNALTRWYREDGPYTPEQLADVFARTVVSAVISDRGLEGEGVEGLRHRIRAAPRADLAAQA
ncbi:TetR/AcrR family transcriptional regulator [Streptomyces carpinensis]|uniref:TetR/AcrR family transcriptional regulator n=1 Tax=Streptomyces carpinensis TaxID=66369 RepID=A0ABV1WAH5_9ACTN|nr:TetR/AcrR family transcriptional regulator [Streptomyces carpinensis]